MGESILEADLAQTPEQSGPLVLDALQALSAHEAAPLCLVGQHFSRAPLLLHVGRAAHAVPHRIYPFSPRPAGSHQHLRTCVTDAAAK